MQFKTLFLIFSVVSLVACSSTSELQQSEQAKLSPAKQKGFSLSFPDQDKWAVVKKSKYKVAMTKPGLAYDDRYVLQVLVVELPRFNGDEDFMAFVTTRMKESQEQSGAKVVEQHAQFVEKENKKCVQYNIKKKHSGKLKPVMLETVSFTCRHPDRGNAGVYLAYSKKYSLGNNDESFNVNASDIFSHMELAAF